MTRKREKPYFARNLSSSLAKRLRPAGSTYYEPEPEPEPEPEAEMVLRPVVVEEEDDGDDDQQLSRSSNNNQNSSTMVIVTGLSHGCSVLNLKSRFEMYGSISRIRIDNDVGYITFRSKEFAEAAMADSLDPFLGITVDSRKVSVSWPSDPLPGWREGVSSSFRRVSPTSKLLRPEVPLRKHGRGKKLNTAALNPRSGSDLPFKGREIVAYDDIL